MNIKQKTFLKEQKQAWTRRIKQIEEMKEVTKDATKIQRIIQECYKILHGTKLYNLEEIDTFLDVYNLLRMNYEDLKT